MSFPCKFRAKIIQVKIKPKNSNDAYFILRPLCRIFKIEHVTNIHDKVNLRILQVVSDIMSIKWISNAIPRFIWKGYIYVKTSMIGLSLILNSFWIL